MEKVGRRLVNTTQSSPENNLDSDDSIRKGKRNKMNNHLTYMQTDLMHFDDQCPSLDSVCMSSFSNPPSLGGQPPLPSSLHDSLPDNGSCNLTKLSRPICNTPSSVPPSPALVTIDESDEDMLSSDDEKNVFVQPFKRG